MAKDYNISKTSGTCVGCETKLSAGDEFVAVVRELDGEFQREDYCLECWESPEKAPETDAQDLFGTWRSRVRDAEEKKKLFVDDDLLINFFERLDGATDDLKLSFRFVLALVLMRKKLLVYDRMERGEDGTETWEMHLRGSPQGHRVIDPKMDEDKIAEVSTQLGQILEGEL